MSSNKRFSTINEADLKTLDQEKDSKKTRSVLNKVVNDSIQKDSSASSDASPSDRIQKLPGIFIPARTSNPFTLNPEENPFIPKCLTDGTWDLEQRICKDHTTTKNVRKDRCTDREATKPFEIPLVVKRSHVRRCKTSPMAVSMSTVSKLPNISETEPEEISLEKQARELQIEKEIFLEELKKIGDLKKACNENMELLSKYKIALETLTAVNENYKAMKAEILPQIDAAKATRSSSRKGLKVYDSAFSETDNYAPDSAVY